MAPTSTIVPGSTKAVRGKGRRGYSSSSSSENRQRNIGTGNLGPTTYTTGYGQPTVYPQGISNQPAQFGTSNQPLNYPATTKQPGFV